MRKNIAAGFIVLLPLLITYTIIAFVVKVITGPLEKLMTLLVGLLDNGTWIFSQQKIIYFLSSICIVTVLVAFIIFVGMIGRWVIIESLLYFSDECISKIPIINKIYRICKDITGAFFSQKSSPLKEAVLVPYPSMDQLSMGFVTAEFIHSSGEPFVSVLVPGIPNPTVGFLCSFPKKSVTFLDMTVDDALKYLMSCGSSLPKKEISNVL